MVMTKMVMGDDVDHQGADINRQDVDRQGDVDHQDDGVDQDDNATKGESCVIPHNKLTNEAAFFRSCLYTYYRTTDLMEEKLTNHYEFVKI